MHVRYWIARIFFAFFQVAKDSGVDFSNLSNATDSTALFLFPALQLQSAVDSGSLDVTPEVFEAAKSSRLSRGQASVLVTETFKSVNQKTDEEKTQALRQFPQEYLFAMPFMIVLALSQNKDVKDAFDWKADFVDNYHRLLPSQVKSKCNADYIRYPRSTTCLISFRG